MLGAAFAWLVQEVGVRILDFGLQHLSSLALRAVIRYHFIIKIPILNVMGCTCYSFQLKSAANLSP
jgi:hypothetical protein